MAADVMDKCFAAGLLSARTGMETSQLKLVGACDSDHRISDAPGLHLYGSEAAAVQSLPGADRALGGGLTEAMVRFAARFEYARCVEDVMARRSRLLFLDAALARAVAPDVAVLLQQENELDPQLEDFLTLCMQYLSLPD
jgi:glycerol-3-phosphate dehydrogenase